ncbi:sigma-54-dependent Fis family transcriptional regulator [Nocardioides nitrophenolicus]|uniref:sigma-54-dependent Fis family transcriptional regulator n=1 Tax=Nocardioides nitrophenolicus TaxID=60489 RepID=UPI00195B7712|nr:helix-turn-helix domain-containing protein [Nocardioides nitrophenolicus]MBM7517449.1 transcriptional regulator of acetoin/glycerol metabolism [Nocardioides nitrophenolicus]
MPDQPAPDALAAAKDAVLNEPAESAVPAPALIDSWRRSRDALGVPANVRDVPHVGEELLDAHLLEMMRSPLQRFADTLDGTGLGLLLSDANGRILERWVADRTASAHFDKVGTFRGSVLSEDSVGTNGVGTALATRSLVQVRGAEHFADFYQRAVCTGAPLLHPITGSLLGSVTLSSDISPGTELIRPLLQTIVERLRQHILDVETPASRQVLEGFIQAVRRYSEPVVAVGQNGLVIQNALASKLSPAQLEEIQEACREAGAPQGLPTRVTTESLQLQLTTLADDNHVAVVLETPQHAGRAARSAAPAALPSLGLVGRTPEWLAVLQQVARARDEDGPLVIAGEPGTGKMSVATGRPWNSVGSPPAEPSDVVVDAAESHVVGTQAWLAGIAQHLTGSRRLVVHGAETLDRAALAGLRSLLTHAEAAPSVVVTVSAGEPAEAEELAVRLGGGRVVWVPALRERAADLPELWNSFARVHAPGAGMVLRPEALNLLRGHDWTGNLTELRLLVSRLARSGKTGPVGIADLPAALRESAPGLTLIEQVEVRAIRQALQEAGGNRARAAEILGVSRATVYRKMKSYRLIG